LFLTKVFGNKNMY